MPLPSFFYDPQKVRIFLLALAAVLAVAAFSLYLARKRRGLRPAAPGAEVTGSLGPLDTGARAPLFANLFQLVLVLLAVLVAAGFTLVLLPQPTVNRLAEALRLRSVQPAAEEAIAFLYLGDEVAGSDFHLRGAIRNITTEPIEKVDAVVRFYSQDGSLLETAITRMDSESIAPDSIATFHLRISGYKGQFAGYSVGFKLRNGTAVPYKDMRGSRAPE